jgi:hypothetical protein
MPHSSSSRFSDPFQRQSRAKGWLLSWLGISFIIAIALGTLLVYGLMMVGLIPKTEPTQFAVRVIHHLFVAAFFAAGALLIRASRRHFTRRFEDVFAEDPREPVLFLRQFGDDDLWLKDSTLRLSFARTFEERMVRALGAIGPVVAIGRPGDHLPPPGAARIYLPDEAWQAEVSAFIDRSAFIALQTGDTPGIRWEVGQVVSRVRPSRLILVLPMEVSRGHHLDTVRYGRFVAYNADLFPRSLPRDPPHGARFICFDDDWTPQPLITTKVGVESFMAGAIGAKVDERRTAALALMTEFDSVPMLRRPLGIALTVIPSVCLIFLVAFFGSRFYGWAEEQVSTFTWFGRYQSEADVLAPGQPRLSAIAVILQDVSTRLPLTRIPPAVPIEPQIVYGPPEVAPNTDIVTVSEIEHLTDPIRAAPISGGTMSRHLVWASNWMIRNQGPDAQFRRAGPEIERTLALATGLTYVVVVARGSMELAPRAPDTWRASETIRLAVARLSNRDVVAATEVALAVTFEEFDVAGLPELEIEARQLFGRRLRKGGEGSDARASFARDALWREAQRRIPETLQALTGGHFTAP